MSIEDRAQEHEAQQWELRNLNRKTLPPPAAPADADYGPAECEECGADMPPLRRAWRCITCVPCTAQAERLAARHGRRG